jgi:hypothetical protein
MEEREYKLGLDVTVNDRRPRTDLHAAVPRREKPGADRPDRRGVAFLAGPAGRWINGQVIFANGGIA